ncbi:helix-turn-helix domain-containing protein [Pseudotenacibaculum haliotis]|uniref:Helix-turn-helix domain-containing protein n=1 Tax=Pseudotenacibaculum haliotis TaxID=1862138 RepID=A0ABW5LX93_9FLAO
MKSKNIILFLCVLLCSKVFAFTSGDSISTYTKSKERLYNLYLIKHEGLSEQSLLEDLQRIEEKGGDFSEDDLKKLALGYAHLEVVEKSATYTELYIKEVLDIDILYDSAFDNIKSSVEFQALTHKYLPKLNFWVILLFACGLIGIFLSVVLNLRKKGDAVGNLLISIFIMLHAMVILQSSIILSNNKFKFPDLFFITAGTALFIGPLLYFYFKRISERYRFKWVDIVHLIPPLIPAIYFISLCFITHREKIDLMFNGRDVRYTTSIIYAISLIAKAISLSLYAFLIYKVYRRNSKKKIKLHDQIIKWKRNMMRIYFAYTIIFVVPIILKLSGVELKAYQFPQIILTASTILYMSYVVYVQPKVFSKKFIFVEVDEQIKYQKSGLTNNFSEELKANLLALLHEEKVFKQNDISLDILAEQLDTTRHNISQVINEHFDMNFFHLINKYRIEEAKMILKNDHNRNLHIIDVAYDVGFNNKVTFNKAFKAETNMTPTEYIQRVQLELTV